MPFVPKNNDGSCIILFPLHYSSRSFISSADVTYDDCAHTFSYMPPFAITGGYCPEAITPCSYGSCFTGTGVTGPKCTYFDCGTTFSCDYRTHSTETCPEPSGCPSSYPAQELSVFWWPLVWTLLSLFAIFVLMSCLMSKRQRRTKL